MHHEAFDDLTLQNEAPATSARPFSRHEGAWTACAVATLVYACSVAIPRTEPAAGMTGLGAFGLITVAVALLGLGLSWLRRIDEGQLPIPFGTLLWLTFPSVLAWVGVVSFTPVFQQLSGFEVFLFSFIWMMLALLSMALIRVWRVAEPALGSGVASVGAARVRDYLSLGKPGLNALVLFTAFVGFYLASIGPFDWALCFKAMLGTALFAAGSSALNQYIERHVDVLMRRTAVRPLPSGRIRPRNGVLFAMVLIFCGTLVLTLFVNLMTAFLAMATLAVYIFLYTPLKRIDTFSTLAGGVSGALPPVIGWTAAGGRLDGLALSLFFILFLWQVPHFLSIAWKYRDQYARAGFQLITVDDESGRITARQSLLYAIVLFVVGLLPVFTGRAGSLAGWGAVLLGGGLVVYSLWFLLRPTKENATRLFFTSIVYLPLMLIVMMLDKFLS